MKQSDIAVLILVVTISLIASYFVGNTFIRSDEKATAQVEVVAPVPSEYSVPSEFVFNANSINPTEDIKIGESKTNKPFNSGGNN